MITPTGHRVVVKADPAETTTKTGIVITTDEKLEKSGVQRGVIVATGPSCWKAFRERDEEGRERNGRPWAKAGDYVLFARHAGRYVDDPFTKTPEDGDMLIMNDEDIIAILSTGENVVIDNEYRNTII